MRQHLMTWLCAAVIISIIPTALSATTTFKPNFNPSLKIPRLEGKISIDGRLDDQLWKKAARAANFAEVNPGDQTEPAVKSTALIAYTATHLYVALIANDDPATIRASISDRDAIFRDDYFGIMIDTYGDASWGYELFVNPYGIQGDLRMLGSGGEDMSFDIIWESEGIVTDSGYQVELAIPFSSLRFPDQEEQVWKVNFWRDHQRDVRRRYAWAAQDRDESCFICQWGTVTGIKNISAGSGLEILPNLIGSQSSEIINYDDPNSGLDHSDLETDASFNLKYGLSSSSTIEMTVNPDFSQVESDAAQINVNTTFALFFPERRPFFQEGSDLFGTWIDGVYTRSINDPQYATKFTGQSGRYSMAYIFARDENSPMIVPLTQRSVVAQNGKSTSNIIRGRRTFGEDSFIGFLGTSRVLDDGGSGSVAGFDSRIRLSKNLRIEWQSLVSYTDEFDDDGFIDTTTIDGMGQAYFDDGAHTVAMDNENYWGGANYLSLERSGRVWNLDIDYFDFSPTFRTDNGFTTSNDSRMLTFWTGLNFNPNKKWLINWEPSISMGRKFFHNATFSPWNFDEGVYDEWVRAALYFSTVGQTSVSMNYLNSRERFSGFLFEGISVFTFNVDSRFSQKVSGGMRINGGRTIWRRHFREYDEISDDLLDTTHVVKEPDIGFGTNFSFWATFRPTERLRIEPSLDFSKLDHSDDYLEKFTDEEKEIFSGYILRTRINYQFSREWFLRLVVQYDDFDNGMSIEPLLTYRINPFTVFYVGASSNYQYYDKKDDTSLNQSEWAQTERQFFFKLQYLFKI